MNGNTPLVVGFVAIAISLVAIFLVSLGFSGNTPTFQQLEEKLSNFENELTEQFESHSSPDSRNNVLSQYERGGQRVTHTAHVITSEIIDGNFVPLPTPIQDFAEYETLSERAHFNRFEDVNIRPANWPTDLPWNPARYAGPFLKGSNFEDVQIYLNTESFIGPLSGAPRQDISWHNNNYFTDQSESVKQIYKKYWVRPDRFDTMDIPHQDAPMRNFHPGSFPIADGPNDILLELQDIRYTSKYGGSILLEFRSVEDNEYDFRFGDFLYDVDSLIVSIFVVPEPEGFNPTNQLHFSNIHDRSAVFFEYEPFGITIYEFDSGITDNRDELAEIRIYEGENPPDLKQELENYSLHSIQNQAISFAMGYIHALFNKEIEIPQDITVVGDPILERDKVEEMMISDGYIEIITSERIPIIIAKWNVVAYNVFTEPGKEEITIVMDSGIEVEDPAKPIEGPRRSFSYENFRGTDVAKTPLIPMFTLSLEECQLIQLIEINVSLIERDPFNLDDVHRESGFLEPEWGFVPCDKLEEQNRLNNFGIVTSIPIYLGHQPSFDFELDANLVYFLELR